MKLSLVSLVVAGLVATLPVQFSWADDAPASTNAPAAGAPAADGQGDRAAKLKAALEQLDLTDAQKDQIKQIRANTSPGRERRQQIMAVLTPEQKEKLKQMIQEHRAAAGN